MDQFHHVVHGNIRDQIYAQMGPEHMPQLRAMESTGDSAARRRRRALTRQHMRRVVGRNGTRSTSVKVRTASLVAKLVPVMTVAVRIIRGMPNPVPWWYGHRMMLYTYADSTRVEDLTSDVTVTLRRRTETRFAVDTVTWGVDGVTYVVGFDRRGVMSGWSTTWWDEDVRVTERARNDRHVMLKRATHLALRRAKQIVDAEDSTTTATTTVRRVVRTLQAPRRRTR